MVFADIGDILQFLYENRLILILTSAATIWVVWYLRHTGKLKKPSFLEGRPKAIGAPVEQRLVKAESEGKKLTRQVGDLELALGEIKLKLARKDIVKMAEEKVRQILPEEIFLFDRRNQLAGRPIFFLGGVPAIQKDEELNRLVERHPLSRLSERLTRFALEKLFFHSETLYFWTATLLPNGKWVMTATSKPPRRRGNHLKLPLFCKQYILLTAGQAKIDQLILNMQEVVQFRASIILSSTVLGALPVKEIAKVHEGAGWKYNVEGNTD